MVGGSVKTRTMFGSQLAEPRWRRLTIEPLEHRQLLTAIAVTSLADTIGAPGQTSLRDALLAANSAPAGSTTTITFASSLFTAGQQTLTLNGVELPQISGSVQIQGPGSNLLTIDGAKLSRIFDLASSATVELSGMTLADGLVAGNGGAINNLGTLSIENSQITSSATKSGSIVYYGGGIYNGGNLTVSGCGFSQDTADQGGALCTYVAGASINVAGSTFSNNTARLSGFSGGAILNYTGKLTVSGSTFTANQGYDQGGAICSSSSYNLNISNSTFSDNKTIYGGNGAGGAIAAVGTGNLTLTGCTITDNTGNYLGGGVQSFCTTTTITNSTIAGNSVDGFEGWGGGLYCGGVSLNISNSTISGNSANQGGGIQGDIGLVTTITNSTIVGNIATIETGLGGGIEIPSAAGATSIYDSTIADNSAQQGGGIYALSNVSASDTIFAGNTASSSAPDISGSIYGNYNLVQNTAGGFVIGSGNVTGQDPNLAASLASNGGPTQTLALLAGSPAIDSGDPSFSSSNFSPPMTSDQRGFGRVANGRIDIGAYEFGATSQIVAPVTAADSYVVLAGTSLATTAANGVLSNDLDGNGLALTATLIGNPAHGSVSLAADGSFLYRPTSGYVGTDSFTYQASDGALSSAITTVTLTVETAQPTAAASQYSMRENSTLTVASPGVLTGAVDPNGLNLSAVLVSNPSHGALTLNADGSFSYISTVGFAGTDSFSFQASDGQASSATTFVTINVAAPPAANNDSYNVSKNVKLTVAAPGVLANDTDSAGLAMTATLVGHAAHGTLSLSSSGGFTYIPNTGYTGPDSFTYTVSDGSATSNVGTVSLTISYNAPVVVSQSYALNENLPLTVGSPGLLTGASDANGDTLSVTLVAGPANGNVVVNPGGGFTYTPSANFTGIDSFTYRASDGSLNSSVATVSLTVNSVTQPPTAADESYTLAENGQLSIGSAPRLSVIAVGQTYNSLVYDANNGLLYGDTDTSIQSINPLTGALGTAVPVSGNPGKMVISSNGQYIYAVIDDGGSVLRFTTVTQSTDMVFSLPAGLQVGTISAIPGRPESVLISMYYPGFSPPAGGTDVFQNGVALPDHVGAGLGTGGPDESLVDPDGVDAFGYDSTDSSFGFVFMTIDDNGIQLAPGNSHPLSGPIGSLAEADGLLFSSTGHAVDLATSQSIGTWSGGANYAIDIVNNKLFSIFNNGSTQTIFSYTLDTITPLNSFSIPVAGDDANLVRFGQNGLAFLGGNGQTILVQSDLISGDPYRGILADNTNLNNLPLTAQLLTNVQHGTLALNSDGTFTYSPNPGFFGTDSFTYQSTNGTLDSNPATVTLQVNAPPIVATATYSVGENTQASFAAAQGVLAGAVDPNGFPLTASLVSGPKHGTLTLNSDGSFNYVPANNYFGTDSFTFKANDGFSSSAVTTINLGIHAPPVLSSTHAAATVAPGGGTLNYAVLPTISDSSAPAAGDELQLTVPAGTLTIPNNADVTIVAGSNGSSSLTIQGSLAQLDTALADLTYVPSGSGGAAMTITPIDPTSGSGGAALAGVAGTVAISVTPLHAPTVTNAATLENIESTSGLVITPNALDATAVTNFQITGIAGGTLFLSDGLTPVVNGQFITVAQGAAGLEFTPAADSTASGSFAVQASTSASAAGLGGPLVTATITITIGSGPVSSITTSPTRTSLTDFSVSWAGSPGSDGSAIAGYNIVVSTDAGPFTPWLSGTTATSADFSAQLGHSYGFTSQAIDASGAIEPAHATADTLIVTMAMPWHNPNNPLDVIGSGGAITPIDALIIINDLNTNGPTGDLPASAPASSYYLDVLGENAVFALDVLQVINYLNTGLTLANGASSAAVAAPAASSAIASTVAASPSDGDASATNDAGQVTPVSSAPANRPSAVDMALSVSALGGSLPAVQSSAASLTATTASTNEGTPTPASGSGSPAGMTPLAARALAGSGSGLRSSAPQARAVDALLTGPTPDWLDA